MNDDEELQNFRSQPIHNQGFRTYDVTKYGVKVPDVRMVSSYPPGKVASTGNVFVQSATTEQHSIKAMSAQ